MNEFYASGLTNISTHTLTWSVTFSLLAVIFPNVYFNSHAHVERDRFYIFLVVNVTISTHTLTWSVTSESTNIMNTFKFQLTRSRGA